VKTAGPVKTVSIVGVGLIGGSFALALRKAGFHGKMIGVSSPATLEKALARGVIDQALPLGEAAAVSDLIYLAQPISQILDTLDVLDTYIRPGTLITDAGSTKAVICERGAAQIQHGLFVGGHPMAGKESRGVEEAEADLFRGRPYVLTSPEPRIAAWVELIGARLVILDPLEHDRLVALVSHVPQLVSTALASVIGSEPKAAQVAGPAAVDLTRLALSPYDVWRDIFATNSVPIRSALKALLETLEATGRQIDQPEMKAAFGRAAKTARALRSRAAGTD
jgi:prephenate dehydrogenase